MKLRNKKTGEIFDTIIREKGGGDTYSIIVCNIKEYSHPPIYRCILGEYDSLAKLNEDWEDYKLAEPLIKDEKIRKAVKAWAEVNVIKKIIVFDCGNNAPHTPVGAVDFAENGSHLEIRFRTEERFDTDRVYTIEELCGEENSRPVIVNGVKYSSYEDYLKSRGKK